MLKGPIPLKVIKTQRLLIRPTRSSDASLMHEAMKDSFEDLKAWMPWAQSLASLRDTEVYLVHGERIWSSPAHEGVEQQIEQPLPFVVLEVVGGVEGDKSPDAGDHQPNEDRQSIQA